MGCYYLHKGFSFCSMQENITLTKSTRHKKLIELDVYRWVLLVLIFCCSFEKQTYFDRKDKEVIYILETKKRENKNAYEENWSVNGRKILIRYKLEK